MNFDETGLDLDKLIKLKVLIFIDEIPEIESDNEKLDNYYHCSYSCNMSSSLKTRFNS